MPKNPHSGAHAVKRKAKKRAAEPARPAVVKEPVQLRENARSAPAETAIHFRPRARDDAVVRGAAARGAVSRTFQQVVDYSYVYTDLRIIAGLSVVLFGSLLGLSFALH